MFERSSELKRKRIERKGRSMRSSLRTVERSREDVLHLPAMDILEKPDSSKLGSSDSVMEMVYSCTLRTVSSPLASLPGILKRGGALLALSYATP